MSDKRAIERKKREEAERKAKEEGTQTNQSIISQFAYEIWWSNYILS